MENQTKEQIQDNISLVGHLTSDDLAKAIASAEVVIARSGYTTIMDLFALGKKAILIPTPGQTEQVYLADFFHEQKVFLSTATKCFGFGQSDAGSISVYCL